MECLTQSALERRLMSAQHDAHSLSVCADTPLRHLSSTTICSIAYFCTFLAPAPLCLICFCTDSCCYQVKDYEVVIYQNQRRTPYPPFDWSNNAYTRANYTNLDFSSSYNVSNIFQTYPPLGYEWVNDWYIEKINTDSDGWSYGIAFRNILANYKRNRLAHFLAALFLCKRSGAEVSNSRQVRAQFPSSHLPAIWESFFPRAHPALRCWRSFPLLSTSHAVCSQVLHKAHQLICSSS